MFFSFFSDDFLNIDHAAIRRATTDGNVAFVFDSGPIVERGKVVGLDRDGTTIQWDDGRKMRHADVTGDKDEKAFVAQDLGVTDIPTEAPSGKIIPFNRRP